MCCNPERSEGSVSLGKEILSEAKDDSTDFGRETSLSALIGINLRKSSSPSVGARVVRSGGEGLYGRPRPGPCAHLLGNAITPPPPGDHKGPPHIHSTALAPTDHSASCLASRLRLMPIGRPQGSPLPYLR